MRIFGEGCRMREGAKIFEPEFLVIGKYCWIGENVMLDASGGLTIGDHCSFGVGSQVWTHDSSGAAVKRRNYVGSPDIVRRPVVIGSGVFIGPMAVILPGAVIGDGAKIQANTVISGRVEEGGVVLRNNDIYLEGEKGDAGEE